MRLVEQVFTESLPASAVDKDAGVIRGVKVLGRVSKHGWEYTDRAFNDAAKFYEGLEVNLDHPPRSKGAIERSVRDTIGELRNCKVLTEGVFADLHFIKSHPFAPQLVETAERFPRRIGLSHVADGDRVVRGGRQFIEGITRAISADLVSRPATNAGLFESEGDMSKPTQKTVKQVLESAPEKTAGRKLLARLVEMEAVDPALTVDMPAAADGGSVDPADEVKAALKRSAHAVIDEIIDGGLDKAEGMKKLRDLFGLGDKVDAALNGEGGGSSAGEGKVEEGLRELKGRFALMEAENAILKAGRETSPARAKAVAALSDPKERKELIESFPAAAGGKPRGDRPARTGSVLRESDDGRSGGSGNGSYAEMAKDRKWAKDKAR